MKLEKTDSINSAIKKLCGNSTTAGSIIVLLQREYPSKVMDYMHAMDRHGLYGVTIANVFVEECGSDIYKFIQKISE